MFFFFIFYYTSLQDMQFFKSFCRSNKSLSYFVYFETVLNEFVSKLEVIQIFFLCCPRHFDRGLIVVIGYYFQIWNEKVHKIIICRVTSGRMGPIFIETQYIIRLNFLRNDIVYKLIFRYLFIFTFINRLLTIHLFI